MNVEDFPCNLSSLWHHSSRGEGRNYGRFLSFSADDFKAASPPKGLMENNCMRHAPRALFCDFWWKIQILMAWSKSTLSHVQARNWVFLVKTVKITVLTPLFPTFFMLSSSTPETSNDFQYIRSVIENRLWSGEEDLKNWVFYCFSVGGFKDALAPKGLKKTNWVNGFALEQWLVISDLKTLSWILYSEQNHRCMKCRNSFS